MRKKTKLKALKAKRGEIAVKILQEMRTGLALDYYAECPDCQRAGHRHYDGCKYLEFEELDDLIQATETGRM